MEQKEFEVIIIGGSYAGLSAAMTLGRSIRKVLVIDAGMPCNRQTPHSHNFLTQDGNRPAQISALGRQQVEQYDTVKFFQGLVLKATNVGDGFFVETESGDRFGSSKLIIASGVRDLMPEIPGFAECWGISVIHCPYCHGYEYRNQRTGLMANGDRAVHLAGLVLNLTKDLFLFTNGQPDFSAEQLHYLQQANVQLIDTKISELIHQDGKLDRVVFADGSAIELDALYAAIPFVQHTDIPVDLGCELTETGHLKIDAFQKTAVPGMYACGDCTTMMRSVASAVSSGHFAGAMVNMELVSAKPN